MEPASKSVGQTPMSSPGLFAPATPSSSSAASSDGGPYNASFLHWTQKQQPRETHIADKDIDPISGRKLLNQYEIIDELGRGVHGKVKLGRNLDKGNEVAIKIVARYSKRRRLGKLGNPEDKVKKEVAILKKAIHPNVVSLLEVIDDPAIMKVYIVLEFVELGEIVWRTKGAREVVWLERRRVERESRGHFDPAAETEDQRIFQEYEARREAERVTLQEEQARATACWSLEHGGDSDYEDNVLPHIPRTRRLPDTPPPRSTSRAASAQSSPVAGFPKVSGQLWSPTTTAIHHSRLLQSTSECHIADLPSRPASRTHASLSAPDELPWSSTEPRLSIRSVALQSSPDLFGNGAGDLDYDVYAEDFSYVPCLTIEQARQAFRDTILGLEYLHYQGIIHRDIKPANLLWTAEHRVKISDFGVSYLGRPIRDDDLIEEVAETDASPLDEALELAKTVGTPAFYAPELCYTDLSAARPPVTGQIDMWALGVTLYCLLFARLPFRAEDEYQLFRAIAEEELFIPRRRLKAVDPCLSSKSSSYPRLAPGPAEDLRLGHELLYEPIDDDLYDLLKRILTKDPSQRITLKELKRHPFTLQGITDPVRWIDETDPTRQNEGRKIEVSREDMEKAVVSIGFLERVRSGMRKVGHAIGFGKAREGRRRARGHGGSTAESGSDSLSPTPTLKEHRRHSLRGDDVVAVRVRTAHSGEHPLSQSVTASPEATDVDAFFPNVTSHPVGWPTSAPSPAPMCGSGGFLPLTSLERTPSISAASTRTVVQDDPEIGRDPTITPLLSPRLPYRPKVIEGHGRSHLGGLFGGADGLPLTNSGPAPHRTSTRHLSPKRASALDDTHSDASTALSPAVATGYVNAPPTHMDGPISLTPEMASPAASESSNGLHSPSLLRSCLSGPADSHRSLHSEDLASGASSATAPRRRAVTLRSDITSAHALPHESTEESFARAQQVLLRRRQLEVDDIEERRVRRAASSRPNSASLIRCPPSPDDEIFFRQRSSQADSGRRLADAAPGSASHSAHHASASSSSHLIISSSSEDQMTSGMSGSTSYPSVPSVISAGSSISTEDLAQHLQPKMLPPALQPEGIIRAPLTGSSDGSMALPSDDDGYVGDHGDDTDDEEEEEDSDGDDFLVMTRRRSRSERAGGTTKPPPRLVRHTTGGTIRTTRSGSTGTLKKTSSREEDDAATASESKVGSPKIDDRAEPFFNPAVMPSDTGLSPRPSAEIDAEAFVSTPASPAETHKDLSSHQTGDKALPEAESGSMTASQMTVKASAVDATSSSATPAIKNQR